MKITESRDRELIEWLGSEGATIHLRELCSKGVLERVGSWYRVLDMARLPEHARRRISAQKVGRGGLPMVRFSPASPDAARLYKKLTGRPLQRSQA